MRSRFLYEFEIKSPIMMHSYLKRGPEGPRVLELAVVRHSTKLKSGANSDLGEPEEDLNLNPKP